MQKFLIFFIAAPLFAVPRVLNSNELNRLKTYPGDSTSYTRNVAFSFNLANGGKLLRVNFGKAKTKEENGRQIGTHNPIQNGEFTENADLYMDPRGVLYYVNPPTVSVSAIQGSPYAYRYDKKRKKVVPLPKVSVNDGK